MRTYVNPGIVGGRGSVWPKLESLVPQLSQALNASMLLHPHIYPYHHSVTVVPAEYLSKIIPANAVPLYECLFLYGLLTQTFHRSNLRGRHISHKALLTATVREVLHTGHFLWVLT